MLNKHDIRYKEYIKKENRYYEVQQKLRKLPWTKLKTPYQKGWLIKYDLRPDIKRRKDFESIKQVLELAYYHDQFINDVNTVKAVRKGEKFITKKGKKIDLRPERYHIRHNEYLDLTEKVQSYFCLDTMHEAYKKWERKYYISTIPDHWLVLKAKPNMITHIQKKGGELESELAELKKKMDIFWMEYAGSYKRFNIKSPRRMIRDNINKFKNGQAEEIYNEKVGYDGY